MTLKSSKIDQFKVCAKCGFDVRANESTRIDCIYPIKRDKSEWNCYCNPQMSGCGRVTYATSICDLAKKWNDGETSEIIV